MTESIYVSLSVFILYFYTVQKHKTAIVFMLLLCFIRPNGFIFLLSYLIIQLLARFSMKKIIGLGSLLLIAFYIFLADFVIPRLTNFPFLYHLTSGEMITGVKIWSLGNSKITYCEDCSNSIKILSLVVQNPLFYLKFWIGRILVLFTQLRPYYPLYHNAIVVLVFTPIYYFAIQTIRKEQFSNYHFFLLPIIFETLVVLISGVDWDNRYIVIILPCIFLLAIKGFSNRIKKPTPNDLE